MAGAKQLCGPHAHARNAGALAARAHWAPHIRTYRAKLGRAPHQIPSLVPTPKRKNPDTGAWEGVFLE